MDSDNDREQQICKAWASEADHVDQLETLCRQLAEALKQIAEGETSCCPRCEGNGRLYADGKAHYMSEGAPTIFCGNCGGSGRLQPENAQEIAGVVLVDARKAGIIK